LTALASFVTAFSDAFSFAAELASVSLSFGSLAAGFSDARNKAARTAVEPKREQKAISTAVVNFLPSQKLVKKLY
jgi:hypothetical protein